MEAPNHGQTSNGQRQPHPTQHLTAGAIFLSFLLTVTLIVLQLRGMYDVNRFSNPYFIACSQPTIVADTPVCPTADYAFERGILWSYVSGPLFLIYLGWALYFRRHRQQSWQRALGAVFGLLTYFAAVVILAYVTQYFFQYLPQLAWYFVLGTLALISVVLVIYLERRQVRTPPPASLESRY